MRVQGQGHLRMDKVAPKMDERRKLSYVCGFFLVAIGACLKDGGEKEVNTEAEIVFPGMVTKRVAA